jgi:hypothetical protein
VAPGVTEPKGSLGKTAGMDSANRRSSPDRDLALRRLRRFTIGTAFAGALGSVAFGALAAATYSGTSPSTAAAQMTTTSGTSSTTSGSSSSSTSDDEESSDDGESSDDSSSLQAATAAPTTTTTHRSAQVSTGGS